ncbi:Uncharacterised protein (plasmid) [Tsukamurella tyrosinosolvens]|uniref:Uncharacterized protein n=1 Tax=Tsukamurella tyrosinosolvens TaxID=57704 RepID=A0A1H4V2A1_TSUTY|nr:hypothetical protein [Tsukamurella tyrosinosolvens]KXO91076.1 hypothetical protein AXK58_21845 [Tsukamurella tyrosinosolvens]SEC74930.1 hypothetical protein SAMN04489793_3112 [Tsukamurella tyrosinosolvens]VEH90740.1 Uncharacterised protein [Tsukamurella tyrosinosolvens]
MSDEYLTPEAARARYIEEHELSGLDEQTLEHLVPKFPKGTREYALYAEQLNAALDGLRRGKS